MTASENHLSERRIDRRAGRRRRHLVSWAALTLSSVVTAGLLHVPAAEASFPGDNGRIAYSARRDNVNGIFTVNPNAQRRKQRPQQRPKRTDETRITSAPPGYRDVQPAWSADGSKLAFSRVKGTDSSAEVFVVNADGSGLRQVTSSPATFDGFPSWSPDGTRLVITSGPATGSDHPWRGNGGPWHLVVVDASNGRVINRLTSGAAVRDAEPNWSPDGRRIVFQRRRGLREGETSSNQMYIADASTGQLDELTDTRTGGSSPKWSPDGGKVAFSGLPRDANGRCPRPCRFQVMVIDVRSRQITRVGASHVDEESPAWSPDGARIAFAQLKGGASSLVHSNTDGTDVRGVVRFAVDPDWQPVPTADRLLRGLADTFRKEATRTAGDVASRISPSRLFNLLPNFWVIPEDVEDPSSQIPLPETPPLPPLPLLAPGLQMTFVTQLVDRDPRPHPAVVGAPAFLDSDGRAGPDILAQLSVVGDGLRLTVRRHGTAEIAPPAVRVEAVIDDAAVQAAEGRGFVPTTELRFGYDAMESVMPFSFEETLRQPSPYDLRAHVVTTPGNTLGGPRARRLDLVATVRDLRPGSGRTTGVTVDLDPLPTEIDVAADLGDPLRVEAAVSQATKVVADLTDGPSPRRTVHAELANAPAWRPAPQGSLLNPNSLAVSYSAHRRVLDYHAAAVVGELKFDMLNQDAAGLKQIHVVAHGIPTDVDVNLRADASSGNALVGTYDASGVLTDITFDLGEASGLVGPAKILRLHAEGVPRGIDVRLGDPNNNVVDARGAEIGLLEVTLGDGPEDYTAEPIAQHRDGVSMRSLSDEYLFFARVARLKRVAFVTAKTRQDACAEVQYSFCVDLHKGGPREFQLNLERHFPNRRTDDDPPIEYVRGVLRSAQQQTTFRFGVHEEAVYAYYDASAPTESFNLDTNAGGDPDRINTHVRLGGVPGLPFPAHLEVCITGSSARCVNRTTEYGPIGSFRFHASERTQVHVNDRRRTVEWDNKRFEQVLDFTANVSRASFLAASNTGEPTPLAKCPGAAGEIFVDTDGPDHPLAAWGSLKSFDRFCEDQRHIEVNIPDGFWAEDRRVNWDHPLALYPDDKSGFVWCPAGTRIHVVDAIPELLDPTGDRDIDLDDFLCHGSRDERDSSEQPQ